MGACPKCGSAVNSVVACEHCGASLARPFSFEDSGPTPLPSPVLFKEIVLDRRKAARDAAAATQPAWAIEAEAAAQRVLHEEFEVGEWLGGAGEVEETTSPVDRALRFGEPIELDAPELELQAAKRVDEQMEIEEVVDFEEITTDAPVREIRAVPATGFAQLGAWLVDAAVVTVLFAIYLVAAQAIVGTQTATVATGVQGLAERAWALRHLALPGIALIAALSFVYSCLLNALGGRTLGKWLFGLTVVDTSGMPPPLARSAVRSLIGLFSFAVGFVYMLFDRRRQAIHDKLTHTFVVRLAR